MILEAAHLKWASPEWGGPWGSRPTKGPRRRAGRLGQMEPTKGQPHQGGGGLVWGLVPYRLATKCGRPPPPIYMGAPSPFEGIQLSPNSFSLPHVWFRNIGAAYGVRDFSTKYHRRDIGASVELFIFRCCRWTRAGGSSLHCMRVELRRCYPL